MKTRFGAALVLGSLIACGAARAQPSSPSSGKVIVKQRESDDLERRRQKPAEEISAELKARQEWGSKRRQLLSEWSARRAECKKEADQQNLHLLKRMRFVKKCAGNL
jgi:hypothetical protein